MTGRATAALALSARVSTNLEAWAGAMAIDAAFGDDAAAYISDQIETHIMAGDAMETARWHRINQALVALRGATKQ